MFDKPRDKKLNLVYILKAGFFVEKQNKELVTESKEQKKASKEKIKKEKNSKKQGETKNNKSKKETLWQAVKFTLFSISAGAIQLCVNAILYDLIHWYYWPSYLIALVCSVIWNFTFNRKFTFKDASNVPIAMLKVLGYYAVFTPLSTWWGWALEAAGWPGLAVTAFSMIINFVTEFVFQKFVVFRKPKTEKQQVENKSLEEQQPEAKEEQK